MKKVSIGMAIFMACCQPLIAEPVTYTYTGLPLSENSLGLTQLTATFTVDRPLTESAPLVILPAGYTSPFPYPDTSAWLLSWSMSDGLTTFSSANGDLLVEPWEIPIAISIDDDTGLPDMWHLVAMSSAAFSEIASTGTYTGTGEILFRSDFCWGFGDDPLTGLSDTVVWVTGDGTEEYYTAFPNENGWTKSVPTVPAPSAFLLGLLGLSVAGRKLRRHKAA